MSLTIKSSAIGFGLGELALGQTFDVLEYRLVTPRYALVSINRLLLPEPSLGIVRRDVSSRSCSCLPIYMLSLKSSSQSRCRTPRLRRFASLLGPDQSDVRLPSQPKRVAMCFRGPSCQGCEGYDTLGLPRETSIQGDRRRRGEANRTRGKKKCVGAWGESRTGGGNLAPRVR